MRPVEPGHPAGSRDPDDAGLRPYVSMLWRQRLLVGAVMAAALLGSAVWLAVRSPDYEAKARVLITPVSHDVEAFVGLDVPRTNPDDPVRPVQTAAELLDSSASAQLAARRLGRGWSSGRVAEAVEVEPIGETDVIAVLGRAESPRLAARVADAFAVAAVEVRRAVIREQVDRAIALLKARSGLLTLARGEELRASRPALEHSFSLVERAKAPGHHAGPSAARILVISLVAGLALGSAAAFAREALSRR